MRNEDRTGLFKDLLLPPIARIFAPHNFSDIMCEECPTSSWSSATTEEHCPTCRAATPDLVAARVRLAAVVLFARQLRLEVAELATLLGVPLPAEGF